MRTIRSLVAGALTILPGVFTNSAHGHDVAAMIARLRACEGRLAVDRTYAAALDAHARGDVRTAGRLVSRLINVAYAPVFASLAAIFDGLSPLDRLELVRRARLENKISDPFPRSEARFREAHARIEPRPERIELIYDYYLKPEALGTRRLGENFATLSKRKFRRFMMVVPKVDERNASGVLSPFSFIPTNVTGYGPEFTRKLILAGRVMNLLFGAIDPDDLDAWASVHHDVLLHETVRGKDLWNEHRRAAAPAYRDGVREGILSVVQAITLLMAERVPSLDDPGEVLRLIATAPAEGGLGLINKLAVFTPPAFIGPMSLNGYFLPGFLRVIDGELSFDPAIKARLVEIRQAELAKARPTMAENRFASQIGGAFCSSTGLTLTGQTGTGCPVATAVDRGHDSGLQIFASLFYKIYRLL